MGIQTGIEWCDSTLNLQMGCDGCELWPSDDAPKDKKRCYAGSLTERHAGHSIGYPEAFGEPKLFPERLVPALKWKNLTGTDREDKPWLNGLPRLIFLDDMGDTFTESLPIDWLGEHVRAMAASPHVWIILTKRPARMVTFWDGWCKAWVNRVPGHGESPIARIPPNFWLLTSITSQDNIGRVRDLLKLRALGASVLGVSYEPAWGPVDFAPFVDEFGALGSVYRAQIAKGMFNRYQVDSLKVKPLDWLIAGGESGSNAKPSHPDWFRSARDQCKAAGVPFFFKQWGEWVSISEVAGRGDHHHFPDGATVRRTGKKAAGSLLDGVQWREFPKVHHYGLDQLSSAKSGSADDAVKV